MTVSLNTQAANKLINEKVFNNVTKKGDKFKFKTVENLSAEPALWTGKEDKTITDDKGQSMIYMLKLLIILLNELRKNIFHLLAVLVDLVDVPDTIIFSQFLHQFKF